MIEEQEVTKNMQKIIKFFNSPFGLLIAGAIISGLLVQYITIKWQQRNWVFQQIFTAEKTKFDKGFEQRYRVLEGVNEAVSVILTSSQAVVVGHMKGVQSRQKKEQIQKYNEAVIQWETEFSIWGIRLETFFVDKELPKLWDTIKKERDILDQKIYNLIAQKKGNSEDILKLKKQISDKTIALSHLMLKEINNMKQIGLVYKK
jgi:hypothetical protein